MAKKKINIVLIIVVLGLWGTVGYKALAQYFFSNETVEANSVASYSSSGRQVERDTFVLEKIHRDPFLNKTLVRSESVAVAGTINRGVKRHTAPVKTVVEKPKEIKNWPSVAYYGFIKSGEKKDELVMLKVGNSIHRLRKGQEVEGLMLNKVYKDSVELSFNKEKRMLRRG